MEINLLKKNLKKFSISPNANIKEAMKLINSGQERICFVIDKKNNILKSITDGDLRRAILKGYSLSDKLSKLPSKKISIYKEGESYQQALKKFSNRITVLPIVDSKGKFKGILRRHDILPLQDIKSKKILVLGLGYVGLTLSMILADNGFSVTGYDNDKKVVKSLKNKKPTFYEKGIQGYIDSQIGSNCKIISNLKNINCDIYFITVGTPVNNSSKKPDLYSLKESVKEISKILKKNDLVILRSTVPIGTTRNIVKPIIEKYSKLKVGLDIFLAFCPERTLEGQALEELKKLPQIIGGYCNKSFEIAEKLFSQYAFTVINVESLEAAEFSKLIDNTFRDTMFAYSNELSLLSEKLNLNLPEIIDKVNLGYSRNRIPKPSPGVGGPCLTKDPFILNRSFIKNKINSELIIGARNVNIKVLKNIYKKTLKILQKNGKDIKKCKIFISGFAFKGYPETSDMRSSTTIDFLNMLKKNKVKNIFGHDFKVSKKDISELGIKYCSFESGIKNADATFIMNNSLRYKEFKIFSLVNKMKKPGLFFDCWQIFQPDEIKNIPGINYTSVGSK